MITTKQCCTGDCNSGRNCPLHQQAAEQRVEAITNYINKLGCKIRPDVYENIKGLLSIFIERKQAKGRLHNG